jgi:Ubiquitin-like domain
VGNQQLAIYNDDADLQPTKVLDDDQRSLGFYAPTDFQILKVRAQVSRSAQEANIYNDPGSGYQSVDNSHRPINGSHRC